MKMNTTEEILVAELFNNSMKKNISLEDELEGIEKLVGDASTRRYFRVKARNSSYVVCLSDPVMNREQNENFIRVQNCLDKNGICVPKLFDVVLEKGYFLEQDLGNNTLLKVLGSVVSPAEELVFLEQAIGQMIRIHSVSETESQQASCALSFDLDKLMYEVNFSTDNFMGGYLSAELNDLERGIIESSFVKICTRLSSELMVLTHRDFHTRNVMINGEKSCVIDFQDARMGLPQYDLVSMLEDNYYLFNDENKKVMKDFYWENFVVAEKLQESREKFDELYDLMAIQRTYKALGTFGSIYVKRNDHRYLKYIGFGFERLRNLLLKYKEFGDLKNIMTEHYYDN